MGNFLLAKFLVQSLELCSLILQAVFTLKILNHKIFKTFFFVKSITSTNAEPLCQTSFELFESALAKLCLTIEEYKSIQLDTSYVQIQTLKFGLKICIYRSSTLPILFKFGLQLINHRFHLSSHTVIKTQLTVTSNYFIVFLT